MNNIILLEKIFISICLLTALIITILWPCKLLLSCHKNMFYFLLFLPLIYVILKQYIYIKIE